MAKKRLTNRNKLHIGQVLEYVDGEKYIVAQVLAGMFSAISLVGGNRWIDPPMEIEDLRKRLATDKFYL